MFREILSYEMAYNFRKPITYVYFGIFFAVAFLIANVTGGAFSGSNVSIGKVYMNSSVVITSLIAALVYYTLLIFPSIIGDSVYRDFRTNSFALFFTKPISKSGYLTGRFLGSFLAILFMLTGFEFGYLIGSLMPWLNQDTIGPLGIMNYITNFVYIIIPDVFLLGSVVFCAAALSRNILFTYIVCIAFYVLQGVAGSLLADISNQNLSAMLDPFGTQAINIYTRYWSIAEQNSRSIPLDGVILYNRLLWMGIGLVIIVITYFSFKMKQSTGWSLFKRKKEDTQEVTSIINLKTILNTSRNSMNGANTRLKQFAHLIYFETKAIVTSIPFIIFMIIGVLLISLTATQLDKLYDTSVYPVSYTIIELAGGIFTLILMIFIIYYTGEVIWKERTLRVNQLYDSLSYPSWLPVISKIIALVAVEGIVLLLVLPLGMIIQSLKGYYHFEIGLYLETLLGLRWMKFILFTVLSVMLQVTINNKYIGYGVVIAFFVFTLFSGLLGLTQPIYLYGEATSYTYSDMNGFGHFLFAHFIHRAYWGSLAGVFIVLTILFWQRGMDTAFRTRLKIAAARFTKPAVFTLVAFMISFICLGSYIFYNTHILHKFQTSFQEEEESAQFEKKYKKYEGIPQPKITDVVLFADLSPENRSGHFSGKYILKNKTSSAIKDIHISMNTAAHIKSLKFSVESKQILHDTEMGYNIYTLNKSMMPGDSMELLFDLSYQPKGFSYSGTGNPGIQYNGTFFNNEAVLPSIGYNPNEELSGDDERKKHGLKAKEQLMPSATDKIAAGYNFISRDADWINFEATISTSPDQIAITPGYLQKEWTENGRKYFHYKMDSKILNFYSILSARYTVKNDKWVSRDGKVVNIEIYYHKGHTYDLDMMIKGIKKSLDYYTVNFGPYQHKQVRILEFPRYATFAQSFPNTIPYSEGIGFIAKVDSTNSDDVAYPFYITCHEVAHQWWGHQIVGAPVQGSAMLSESMSQYSSLMVMEKQYGREMMEKFLRYEMDKYLNTRRFESKGEKPLEDVEFQSYVYYQKGGIAMYALRDYIGEDTLNKALKSYIRDYAFTGPPYTNTRDFLRYIRKATPDSLQYFITDEFEKITFYENSTSQASYVKLPDGRYRVKMDIHLNKSYSDKLGNEVPTPVNDYIEVGVYGASKVKNKPNFIYLQKMKLNDKMKSIEFIVNSLPEKAGIDPRHLLIDKYLQDNTVTVVEEGKTIAKK